MTSNNTVKLRKKLIEVAIPLEAINHNAASEKNNPFLKGHPRNIHKWWARRPFAAASAIIFCQLVDDPSSCPDEFASQCEMDDERERLMAIAVQLSDWDNISNNSLHQAAKHEIEKAWNRLKSDNPSRDFGVLPAVWDPFAGGGAIPYAAMSLGMSSQASDINPVPVIINRMMIDVPHRFDEVTSRATVSGIAEIGREDETVKVSIAHHLRDTAAALQEVLKREIGYLYPPVKVPKDIGKIYPHLASYAGSEINLTSWLWARSVRSPDPMYADKYTPLVSSFCISNSKGKEWYIQPCVEENGVHFNLMHGMPSAEIMKGTKAGGKGGNFKCVYSGALITAEYVREQAAAGEMGELLLAGLFSGQRKKLFIPSDLIEMPSSEAIRKHIKWTPNAEFFKKALGFRIQNYGMSKWSDVFNLRQLALFSTLSDLIKQSDRTIEAIVGKSLIFENDEKPLAEGGRGSLAYRQAIIVYLSFCASKLLDFNNTLCLWNATNQNIGCLFKMHTVSMTWDFPESSPFTGGLSFIAIADSVARSIEDFIPASIIGRSFQSPCQEVEAQEGKNFIVSTDPPYYDNIGYADLSDFFYVWLRYQLKDIFPAELQTVTTPKTAEMVATPGRNGTKKEADQFFLYSMLDALDGLSNISHVGFPLTIYYAFKQSQGAGESGYYSVGWEAFLEALVSANLEITSTWPVRTERESRMRGQGSNALATSLVLSCRRKLYDQAVITRGEFKRIAAERIKNAIKILEKTGIRPIDLAQAVIGPGMSVYSSAGAVLNPDDSRMSIRDALVDINRVFDECLASQESELDSETRFAITFFESYGYAERIYGEAEGLAVARNMSVDSAVRAGILRTVSGRVRILRREELDPKWDPLMDRKLCVWEATQHLIKRLENGETSGAALLARLKEIHNHGDLTSNCRALAYRLYNHCEKTKQADEARAYNGLVIAWPELEKLAASSASTVQPSML